MEKWVDRIVIPKEKLLQNIEHSLKSLRIADLELFITAAHMKNLGKSARTHHLSQSGASAAIQRVEKAFDIPLCTHEKRQFCLTRQGQILLPKLENWMGQIRSLILSEDKIPIRLVTTHAIAQVAVPALIDTDIEFKHMRPDHAYRAILEDEADVALVLDNTPWKGVIAAEVGTGYFQLYARKKTTPLTSVLLPEDQMEVLSFKQSWKEVHGYTVQVKSIIPSWSLIANICASSSKVGFLPDFLALKHNLHPVSWQPAPSAYRVLAIFKKSYASRIESLIKVLSSVFD